MTAARRVSVNDDGMLPCPCSQLLHFLTFSLNILTYILLHANLIPADAYLTPIVGYRGSICVLMMSTFRGYFSDRSELP